MKLLGWMHRKFKQNCAGEPFKDFGIIGNSCNCLVGQPSLDEQQYYRKCYPGPTPSKSIKGNFLRKSFTGRTEKEDYCEEEYSADAESGYFNGLLAIGTLGSDTIILEPETPTFPATVEGVTEKETSIAPDEELRLFNEELEKVLNAHVKDDKWTDSSGRTSQVSTITLSGTDGIGNMSDVCPLQGYLFRSPVEFPEPATVVKKENRTSLGQLFQKTKVEEDIGEREEKRGNKEGEKTVKKPLKKRILGGFVAADSVLAEKKLNKILQMFSRKVHPEGTTTGRKTTKLNKNDIKNNIQHDGGSYMDGDRNLPDEDGTTYHKISVSNERIRCFATHANPSQFAISRSDSNGSREYWIKTDADYLVLEL